MKRKFSDDEVRALRQRHRDGTSVYRLARDVDIPYNTMHQLIKRYTYAEVSDEGEAVSVSDTPVNQFLANLIGDKKDA